MKRSTEKYKSVIDCVGNALSAVTVAAAVSGVGLLSTFAAMPAGIALKIIAAVSGSVTMARRVVSRRLNMWRKTRLNTEVR